MKAYCIFLLLFITLYGCSPSENSAKTDSKPEAKKASCEDIADYQVFSITANLWEEAWKDVLKSLYPEPILDKHNNFLYSRSFNSNEVRALLEECPDCSDIRIYFANYKTPPSNLGIVPDLLMVNAKGCEDILGESYLLVDSAETHVVQLEEAKAAIMLWQESWPKEIDWLYQVLAYTYDRETIENVLATSSEESLDFHFAIHAVNKIVASTALPEEPNDVQGFLNLDLVMKGDGAFLDFAQPCPELCDKASPFYTGASNIGE